MVEVISDFLWLLTYALGPIAIVYGCYSLYPPAAWIVGGLLVFIARCGGIGPAVRFVLKMTAPAAETSGRRGETAAEALAEVSNVNDVWSDRSGN